MSNNDLDKVTIQLAKLQKEFAQLQKDYAGQTQITKSILETMQSSENLFELRCSRVLHNLLVGMAHQLEHVIEDSQQQLRLETQGFDIQVVNGTTVKEGPHSIIVTKRDNTYDYSAVIDPDNIQNENTETFNKYFDRFPEIFGDRTELIVNISMLDHKSEGTEGKE